MKFLIITQVPHVQQEQRYYAYAPYVDEMNIWGKYVSSIAVVAPCSSGTPTAIDREYQHQNLQFTAVPAINLLTAIAILKSVLLLPLLIWKIGKAMQQADHIHLRCPGNMGLLGSVLQIAFPSKPKTAKYAGNWDPAAAQPWSYRLQKWILANTFLTKNMQVLVYGEWPNSSSNIKPFFTASYAAATANEIPVKKEDRPIAFIFVGALVKGKNPLYAIQLVQQLVAQEVNVSLQMYGEGNERQHLEQYIRTNKLENNVLLWGNQSKEVVKKAYQSSHFVMLPSQSEGWPKALAEGMFWGCVPIGTAVSCVPMMLGHGQRGLLLQMDLDTDVAKITNLIANSALLQQLQQKAMLWSRGYTTDSFATAIQKLLMTPVSKVDNAATNSELGGTKLPLRVLQIIDSLEAGGAERMAVNYANALHNTIACSALVVTRKEGPFKTHLHTEVPYLFLRKKSSFDLTAVWRLRTFVKKHHIKVVQAHSTSFFTAILLKCSCPSVQIVWHDHYGDSDFLIQRPAAVLRIVAPFFKGVLAVNHQLKEWNETILKVKKVLYLPNFSVADKNSLETTKLLGQEGKRILCLANLRPQKDQMMLLEVAKKIKETHPEWTFHLVGKDFEDDYAAQIKSTIMAENLEKNVFLYGSKTAVGAIIDQAEIAILTSKSEGLPVALLEYGAHKKAVVVTVVGEVAAVIQNGVNGLLVPSQQADLFADAVLKLMGNSALRAELGQLLYNTVQQKYAETTVISNYINWLQTILK